MLNNQKARGMVAGVVEPVARRLLAVGLTPDAVTYIGAAATSVAALWFFPRGQFVPGVIIIAVFAFSDLLDGTMARLSGRAGPWGNYLDSTLDRVADGAVFGGVLIYFATQGQSWPTAAAWVCLVGGFTISYAKARAESVGATANVGIAERAERLIVILLAAFVTGLGVTWLLPAATAVLALLTLITIAQRFTHVRQQLAPRPPAPEPNEAEPTPAADPGQSTPPPQPAPETGEPTPQPQPTTQPQARSSAPDPAATSAPAADQDTLPGFGDR